MGCPFSWKGYVGMWFDTLVGCRIDIIKAQATEKRGNDMLHTLEKGKYPKGHRYWSNATGDLERRLGKPPVQLGRRWTSCGRTATGWSATLSSGIGGAASSSPPCMTRATRRSRYGLSGACEDWLADVRRSWEPSGRPPCGVRGGCGPSGRLTTPSPRFGWSCRGTWMQTPS